MPNYTLAKALGERIRKLRKEQKLTQEELAHLASLHVTYIGQLERGEKNATIDSISKVANALNITLDELFRFSELSSQNNTTLEVLLTELEKIEESDRDTLLMIINILIEWKNRTSTDKKYVVKSL